MNLGRMLNRGVGSWLYFEYLCGKSGLFNEKYLSYPIGQLLTAVFGDRVHSEFLHPILAPLMMGPGRRPEVDFVYCDPYPEVKVAIETKWIGTTKVSVEEIIWDLIRLALINANSNAECFFMIGGRRRDLEALFDSDKFAGPKNLKNREPILNWTSNVSKKFNLVPRVNYRTPLLKKVFSVAPDIKYPHWITAMRQDPYPMNPQLKEFQFYCWRIYAAKEGHRDFRAKQSRHYI